MRSPFVDVPSAGGGILKLLLSILSLLLIAALGIMAANAWRQYQTATHVHRIDAGADLLLRGAEQMTLERGLAQTALLAATVAPDQVRQGFLARRQEMKSLS